MKKARTNTLVRTCFLLQTVFSVETVDTSTGVNKLLLAGVERVTLEQISTLMSFFVEPVSITAPHAHLIVVCSYLGWIPSFMSFTSLIRFL